MTLEVCCGNLESVHAAVKGGAPRIELCSRLDLDGLTPVWEELREARTLYPALKIHVLIRPREGDFCYTPEEWEHMADEMVLAQQLGADGLVIGALTEKGDVDREAMEALLRVVKPGVALTFHRAFDVCRWPFEALQTIESLGFHRILTSGQAPSALEGTDMLRELQRRTTLTILPGGGVNASNARRILELSGCRELHASASTLLPDGSKVTDAKKVADILSVTLNL